MDHRTLGRTGMKVSPLCLGAMMLGGWGNRDHDDSVRIIHTGLDAGIGKGGHRPDEVAALADDPAGA